MVNHAWLKSKFSMIWLIYKETKEVVKLKKMVF